MVLLLQDLLPPDKDIFALTFEYQFSNLCYY
jgi:hypothetical protein